MILMRKYQFFVFLLVFFLVPASCLSPHSLRTLQTASLSSPAISDVRSSQMADQCKATNRNNLINNYGVQNGFQYADSYSHIFPLNQTVFNDFLKFDIGAINSVLRTHTIGYAIFVAAGLAALALVVLAAPVMHVLLFCPLDSCLRKKLNYSLCEQLWPAALTLFLGMGLVAGSAVGLLSSHQFYSGYQDLSCSGTIIFDDALHGSIKSDESSFFAGTANIARTGDIIDQNRNEIYGNVSRLTSGKSETSTGFALFNQALKDITAIPNSNGNKLELLYPSPLLSSTPSSSIPSTFPDTLGTKDQDGSLIAKSYRTVNSTNSSLGDLSHKADLLMGTQSYSHELVSQMSQQANATSDDLFQGLLQINDLFKTHSPPGFTAYIQKIVYGAIMVLVSLLIFSLLCFMKWDRIWCRHLIYLLGFFLFFATIAVLAVSVGLTFVSAVSYSGCNYLDKSISSPQSFKSSLSRIGTTSSVGNLLSVCLKGQSGDFISAMSGTQTSQYLATITTTMSSLTQFGGQNSSNSINSEYLALQSSIITYSQTQILDVTDKSSKEDLIFLSNPTNYRGCNQGHFQGDSWVPSVSQKDSSIPCAFSSLSSFNVADSSTCPSSPAFISAATGCTGCMDSFSLLNNQTSRDGTANYLNSRYTDCPQFVNHLSNLWINFYFVKKQAFQPVLQRETTARQSVTNSRQHLTNIIDPLVSSTVVNLMAASDSGLDPKYGVLAGLNCSVLGEDIALFKSALCRATFSYSYFHGILLLGMGLCLALLLCCNTCVLFRKKKDILNAVNWEQEEKKVRAMAAPPTDDRLVNPYAYS